MQLLGNILQWDGVLSSSCLRDLALDSTLNRYILSALQTTDTAEDNVPKCRKVGDTLFDFHVTEVRGQPAVHLGFIYFE